METPPPNSQARKTSNAHTNPRNDHGSQASHEFDEKFHKSNELYSKIPSTKKHYPTLNPIEEREIVQRCLSDMRKQIKYIEETNWMFDSEQIIPMENLAGL